MDDEEDNHHLSPTTHGLLTFVITDSLLLAFVLSLHLGNSREERCRRNQDSNPTFMIQGRSKSGIWIRIRAFSFLW